MQTGRRLDDMVVFAAVFEAGSLTRAAHKLATTRSAVSKAVARLEAHLGTRLLQRTTRHLSATPAGHACYARCARIVAEADAAERDANDLRSTPTGPLRVSCASAIGLLLAPLLPRFTSAYPAVVLDIQLTEHIVDLVRAGVDVGIRLGPMADSSLVARKLMSYRRVLCASPDYLSRYPAPRTPADLRRHNCLLRSGHDQWHFRSARQPAVQVRGSFLTDTPELLRQAALAGAGITLLPSFLVANDLRDQRLVRVLERYELAQLAVVAVYPHARHLSPNVRAFVDFVADALPLRVSRAEGARGRQPLDSAKFRSRIRVSGVGQDS
jgi:DNA-binding transcriptional LysR family regulator